MPLPLNRVNELIQVTDDSDIATVRELFEEYFASLTVDLTWQDIDREVASLSGSYSSPRGALLLARANGSAAGCIAVRPFSGTVGELERLYVRPAFRGRGLARCLVSTAIVEARSIGYGTLVLDSLPSMQHAIALYQSFGFERTEPYWSNPFPGVLYFRLALEQEHNAELI